VQASVHRRELYDRRAAASGIEGELRVPQNLYGPVGRPYGPPGVGIVRPAQKLENLAEIEGGPPPAAEAAGTEPDGPADRDGRARGGRQERPERAAPDGDGERCRDAPELQCERDPDSRSRPFTTD
jgi:hypothetical protein